MARKSNKTTHVLNLIAGSGSEETKDDTVETKKEVPGVDNVKGNSPVVKILTHDHDPLSDFLKDALETEEAAQVTKSEPAKGINSEPAIDNTAAAELAAKETASIPAINNNPVQERTTLAQKLEQSQKLHFHDRKDLNSMLDLDFKYINVYERIIQDKVLDYMRKFDMCMCDRCIVDTFALALTNLPTKIVVTDKDSIFPMVSFYETKNTAIISTELIKACMLVKEKPHHE
ncbi:late competence development ComFB family protein [Proteocatella sphenisci]|uniref:late competence development ComFB family protein n=1 Tax=Proteocatella sphenisci TaxID=181070 RepID=UPI00048C53CB|nr:late competence development ComFB family protein [Proteocatella sphenisci]